MQTRPLHIFASFSTFFNLITRKSLAIDFLMITTKLWLDIRNQNVDKTYPLKLVITQHGKSTYVSLGVRLLQEQWDKSKQRVIDNPSKRNLNSFIENWKLQFDNTIRELSAQGKLKNLTVIQIRNAVLEIIDPKVDESKLFLHRFNAYAEKAKAERTKEIYKATLAHITKYDPKINTLGFEDIDKEWLEGFDSYLSKTSPSRNARNIHFRNIRAVFNAAIDDEITSFYPFKKFKLKDEETRKRNLTKDQLQFLIKVQCKPYERKYIDCFFLMFYLSGINGVDLLQALPEQIINGRLEYTRSKTGKRMSIKLEPEAVEIIEKYKGRNRLLKWGEHLKSYKSFMMKLNAILSRYIPNCTSYYARHTIASLAAELDIPNETIAQILGHHDEAHRTTLIYINPEQSKADKACRRIFDYISDKEPIQG